MCLVRNQVLNVVVELHKTPFMGPPDPFIITMDTIKTTIFYRSCEATITKLLVNVGISSFIVRQMDMVRRVVSFIMHE